MNIHIHGDVLATIPPYGTKYLAGEYGIRKGNDYQIIFRDVPDYMFTNHEIEAKLYQAHNQSLSFTLPVALESQKKLITLLVSDSLTSLFVPGLYYIVHVSIQQTGTEISSRFASLCCVCYP